MCGLSSTTPEFAAKIDVYMLTLCSAMEDLARNEKEAVQVRRGLAGVEQRAAKHHVVWVYSINRSQCLPHRTVVCVS